ncbi:peptidylprolyl isomerase [Arenibacterium sp. CAU 1754]
MQLSILSLFHFVTSRSGLLGMALATALMTGPAPAQNLFSPAITVNDDVITYFELQQRAQFLRLLRAPGNPETLAREALIDDRLRNQAVKEAGITITPEDIEAGIEEFATRTDLSGAEFLNALKQGGVEPETMRDFTRTSLAWRELIRSRYLERSRPTQAEIDRAIGQAGGGGGVRVLLSEVIIPFTPQTLDQVEDLAQQISDIKSYGAFSEAARKYSAAETRVRGGRLDWVPINNLPAALRPLILALNPGETTAPIPLPNAVAIFQMRGIQEIVGGAPQYSAIEYAAYYIPGGRSEAALKTAAAVANQVDQCDDLYGIAKDQPPEVLERITKAPSEIPNEIALELAKLDEGEISTALTSSNGQTLVFLMLCGRTAKLNEDASRADVASALGQRRLTAFAESYLDQLRADALIIEK